MSDNMRCSAGFAYCVVFFTDCNQRRNVMICQVASHRTEGGGSWQRGGIFQSEKDLIYLLPLFTSPLHLPSSLPTLLLSGNFPISSIWCPVYRQSWVGGGTGTWIFILLITHSAPHHIAFVLYTIKGDLPLPLPNGWPGWETALLSSWGILIENVGKQHVTQALSQPQSQFSQAVLFSGQWTCQSTSFYSWTLEALRLNIKH